MSWLKKLTGSAEYSTWRSAAWQAEGAQGAGAGTREEAASSRPGLKKKGRLKKVRIRTESRTDRSESKVGKVRIRS